MSVMPQGKYAPLVHMLRLTDEREITPDVCVSGHRVSSDLGSRKYFDIDQDRSADYFITIVMRQGRVGFEELSQ